MRIAYNPLYKPDGKTKVGALTSAPINDIVFDLPGKSIWAKGLKFLGTDSLKIIIGSSSDTVAGTWTGQHSEIGRYEDGLTIIYIPKVAGASTTTLNINGLGAKTCYYSGNSKLTTHYPAGTPILFTYYNDGWRRADYDSNTNYYRPIEVNNTALLGNNNYVLNFKSDDNISYVTTAATSTSKQADLTIGINIQTLKNNLGVSTTINSTSTNDQLPTSKSVYDFVGTYLTSYMHWKGNTPSSGTTFTIPNAAVVGDAYRIAVSGTLPAANSITGSAQIVEVGDIIICTDATGPKYTVAQTNWTAVAGTSALAWNSEVTLATIGGLAIKAKLPANPTLALKSISFTKADGTAVSYNGSVAVDLTGGINYATLANQVRNNLIIKLNGGTTEGTNLFTYNGSAAKTVNITPASIGAATSGHIHTTTIAASTDTNQIALVYGGKYKLTAGGTSYVFTMPASDNTWRPIGTGATDAAAGNHVHKDLIIKWGAGDTENTNLFTYNGSTAKTINLSTSFSQLFTNFSNIGSQTTRITIGGVTKDLKVDADTVDGLHANSFVRSYNSSEISGNLKGNYLGMTTSSGITSDWWHILCGAWNDEFRWNSQLALPTQNKRGLYYRSGLDNNTTFGSWIRVADADGTGASGTWNINISGNAATATNADKLDGIDSTGFLRYYNSNVAPSNVDIVNTPSYVWTVSTTGGSVSTVTKPSGIDNAWGVIHLHTHSGNYATQLGFGGTTNRMYMRNAYYSSTFGNWQALAFTSDIPTVTNYYWANIKVSSTSSTTTTPTFGTATATTSVITPLVHSVSTLILNSNNYIYFKYNNDDTKSVILNSTAFKPFDAANNKLTLGSASARWSNIYSVLGNFTGNVNGNYFISNVATGTQPYACTSTTLNTNLNADLLDGFHRKGLYSSIPAWINANEYTVTITVSGSADTYYPVVISTPSNKEFPGYISVWKNLDSTTAVYPGNHSNGTSSMWLLYEVRNWSWDGNGGYLKCWYYSMPYAALCAKAEQADYINGRLIIYLRGGGTSYNISSTYKSTATIYTESTNIGSSKYPINIAPTTTVTNKGIIQNRLGYGYVDKALTADKWTTARTFTIGNTGKSVDGSANVSWSLAEIGASAAAHTHSVKINGATKTIAASGGAAVDLGNYLPLTGGTMSGNIILKGSTSSDMTYGGNIHPYIRFDNANSNQNISLIFTDYDSYRSPAGIKLIGNQGGEWFEAPNIYATNFYGALKGNADSATKLTSSAGSTALPIYFSDGKPVACTPASLFSNLSNDGNNLSITVAGQNRTLTINYANSAGNADTVDNYHIGVVPYINDYGTYTGSGTWYLKINTVSWAGSENIIYINTNGDNCYGDIIIHLGSRNGSMWGFSNSYNSHGISGIAKSVEAPIILYLKITHPNCRIRTNFNATITKADYSSITYTNIGVGFFTLYGNGTIANADMTDGLHVHTGRNNEANKIVRTDASGYIQAGWINTISGNMGTTAATRIYCSNDDYIRYKTPANFFETLANDGNQISITIGSQNRKLTINYANNSDKIDGYHASSFYVQGRGEIDAETDLQNIPKDISGGWRVIHSGWQGMVAVLGQGHTMSNRGIGFLFKGGQSYRINLLTQIDNTWYDRGIIAYTSDIPTVTNYYWANVKVSASSNTSTNPTFGSATASGSMYAAHFYENSDIRYKEILNNLTINTNTIANLPLFDFKWKENNSIGTGTSAQAVQAILPNIVSGTDKLTLDYGVLGTIAGITACKELVIQKSEIELLKDRIEQLEQQLKMYHGNSK